MPHRARPARRRAPLHNQQISIRISAGKGVAAERCGSGPTWFLDAEGIELAHFGFSAVLRDYPWLGRLLAYDGAWENRQIIPAQWLIDATTVRPSDAYLAPGKAMPTFGYGYLLWVLPGNKRQFAFVGQDGQRICIDPASKLVMIQTALDDRNGEVWSLWAALAEQFGRNGCASDLSLLIGSVTRAVRSVYTQHGFALSFNTADAPAPGQA